MTSSVAAIIPTWNRVPLLRDALASALTCVPAPDEIVVVDCNSIDDTAEVVAAAGQRVRMIRGPYPNAAAARNAGAAETSSAYLAFLDSDDLMLPGKITCLADLMDAQPSTALVHGGITTIDGLGEDDPAMSRRFRKGILTAAGRGTSYAALVEHCFLYTSATLMRRSFFEQVGGYDEKLDTYEDWDLYLRLSLVGEIRYRPDCPSAAYRVWPGNVPWDRTARGVIEVATKHLTMLASVPIEERRDAEFALHARKAAAHHSLVERADARREALTAMRLDPSRGLRTPEVRRAFTRSFLPDELLERRRADRTTS